MKSSEAYYDHLAAAYREISGNRKAYLDAIDQYVVESAGSVRHYLDIGAGDGYRSHKIAKGVRPEKVTLLDNSAEIASLIPEDEKLEVVIASIAEFTTELKYDLITCLWNVLGHVGDTADRLGFFQRVKSLLSPDGQLILDVNNRYNIAHYGNAEVMNNLSKDLLKDPEAGWFHLGTEDNSTRVYVHAPFEIDRMATATGLKVLEVAYVDYRTGEKQPTFFEGQLYYRIGHA